MAGLFRIDAGKLDAAPGARLLKAEVWAECLAAGEILEAARRHMDTARLEAAAALEEEKKRGYEQGILEGQQENAEQMMDTVLKSIEYIEDMEKGVSTLVGDAVRKILGALPPEELMSGVVRQALSLVRGQKQVTLNVSPADEGAVRARLDDILREYSSIGFIDLKTDGRLAKGACTLQSDMGVIDAGVETQIRAIINALEKRRKG